MIPIRVCLRLFAFWDKDGICRYLEKMAAKGWMLEKVSGHGIWFFRRVSPRPLKFSLFFAPPAGEQDGEAQKKQDAFYEMCRHDGWELACTTSVSQIFYNQQPDPIPMETDPAAELSRLHAASVKEFVTPLVMQAIMLALMLSWALDRHSGEPGWLISWVFILLAYFANIGQYLHWYCRARKAVGEGVFLKPPKTFWITNILCLLALIFFICR